MFTKKGLRDWVNAMIKANPGRNRKTIRDDVVRSGDCYDIVRGRYVAHNGTVYNLPDRRLNPPPQKHDEERNER